MISKRQAVIYVSDSGPSTKKFHALQSACMREAFYQLMRHYRKEMDEQEFEKFKNSDEFNCERRNVARAIREEFHRSQKAEKIKVVQ